MFYTYVLLSQKDKNMYTGYTKDLRKRFAAHNAGLVPSTQNRGPFELVYYEACLNEQDATAREKYLKTGMGKRYLKTRLKRFLALTGESQARVAQIESGIGTAKVTFDVLFSMLVALGLDYKVVTRKAA